MKNWKKEETRKRTRTNKNRREQKEKQKKKEMQNMKHAKSSKISKVFGLTREILYDFQGLSLLLFKISTKTSTISMIFLKCDFSKRKPTTHFGRFTVFQRIGGVLGDVSKTHILPMKMDEFSPWSASLLQ